MRNLTSRWVCITIVPLLLTPTYVSPTSALKATDTEPLIEAVMFGTGPIVHQIDAIDADLESELSLGQYIEFRRFARSVIDDVLISDPDDTQNAVTELRSGNPTRVDKAITKLQYLLSASMERQLEARGLTHHLNNVDGSAGYGACSLAIACIVYAALAAHNAVALTFFAVGAGGLAVVAAAFLWTRTSIFGDAGTTSLNTIDRDRLVAQLTLDLMNI